MAKTNIIFNNKNYSIDKSLLANATARLEAHLTAMMGERLEGDGQEFYTMAPSTLSFRSTAPLSELQDIQINGQTVDPANYELEEGSTIVKLKYDYLSTLDVGKYELSVVSDSKTVNGGFTVVEPELNEYGFYYNQPYYAYIELMDGLEHINVEYCFILYDDGTASCFNLSSTIFRKALVSYENDVYTISFFNYENTAPQYEITGTFSENGKTFIGTKFINLEPMWGDGVFEGIDFYLDFERMCSDEEYYYYVAEGIGENYVVAPIDKSKSSYSIKTTNICGTPVAMIAENAFRDNANLSNISIPDSITLFNTCAFYYCTSLNSIAFNGTMEQWEAIVKLPDWNMHCPEITVTCTDGTVIVPAWSE